MIHVQCSSFTVPAVSKNLFQDVEQLISDVTHARKSLAEALSSDCLQKLQSHADIWEQTMMPYQTAQLWILYMKLVAILQSFIRAARTGNWKLYIQTLHAMLPYLAASGHNNYTKSLMLFLNKMDKFEQTNPSIYNKFVEGLFVLRRTDSCWAGVYSDLYIEQVLMSGLKSVGGLTRGCGFEETTSLTWLLSMPACGDVTQAVHEVSDVTQVSDIHKDCTKARMERDAADTQSIIDFFAERKPFAQTTQHLHSLSTGIVADKKTNVLHAQAIGATIITSMEGKSVKDYKFAKKDQVKTLASSTYSCVKGHKVEINPQQLFQRLIVAGVGTIDSETLFKYELSSIPAALFDKNLMLRQADKADLQTGLVKKVPSCLVSEKPNDAGYVIDGGALLQRIVWPKAASYASICLLYTQYLRHHYSNILVVFDGYEDGPSTKDETHQRRTSCSTIGADVDVTPDINLKMNKKTFLANPRNKQQFIHLLGSELEKSEDITVKHAAADADYDIAISACNMALAKTVVVVGDDTDLLVLLQHHYQPADHRPIFMQTSTKLFNIAVLKRGLEPALRPSLLFIHAMSGCDTTSRPFGIGKVAALGKWHELKDVAQAFLDPNKTQEEIEKLGHTSLCILYGCSTNTGLDFERASRFSNKVATSSSYLPPERLPPTSDAAKFHSYRVYHQVQAWIGNEINPVQWGWRLHNNQLGEILQPIKMEQDPAPLSLLKLIRCNCNGPCDRATCSCRKHSLKCTLACGQCKGIACTNSGSHTESTDCTD